MRFPAPRNVRTRLALRTVLVVIAVLTLFTAVAAASLYANLRGAFDRSLRDAFEETEDKLRIVNGTVSLAKHDEDEEPGNVPPWVEVFSLDGELLFRSDNLHGAPLGETELTREPASFRRPDGSAARGITTQENLGGVPVLMRVARSEEPLRRDVWRFLTRLLLAFPFAALLAGAGGFFLADRALRPVDRMSERAAAIGEHSLGERLPVANPHDELGRLATVLNGLLDRLQRSFEELRRFTADASHELRTPLTAIRSTGEVALREERSPAEYREVLGSILEEVDRLGKLTEALLALSRAESGPISARSPIDLSALASRVADHLGVLAEERRQSLKVEAAGPAFVQGDPEELRRAVVNLVDNAIKYAPVGGHVEIRVASNTGHASLEVRDDGPGMSPERAARVFERFYRVDPSRDRETGGAGLGLAIARAIVERHGGRIELETRPGQGATFRVVLPETLSPKDVT